MAPLKYSGSAMFRQRIVAAILSNRPLKIDRIREGEEEHTGLQDFEASFLRLIEELTDGTRIEINETGTTLRLKPGILIGGSISHDCGLSRSIGWFLEGIIPIAIFCKNPVELLLTGITNDEVDLSMDTFTHVTLPLLKNFGLYNIQCKIKKRGMPPKGGGEVSVIIPPVRGSLTSIYITDEGLVKRVRGVAFCTRISPTILSRVVDSTRAVLNNFLPDVHINTDHYKGSRDGGDSPGYSLCLIAETSTGALLSVERTAKSRRHSAVAGLGLRGGGEGDEGGAMVGLQGGEAPETIGTEGAQLLLEEIFSGGVVDRSHQSLFLMLMALTPEDVSKVRFGALTPQTIDTLRILRDAFGVVFRIKEDRSEAEQDRWTNQNHKKRRSSDRDNDEDEEDEEDSDNNESEDMETEEGQRSMKGSDSLPPRITYLLSCLGVGLTNVNRRVT